MATRMTKLVVVVVLITVVVCATILVLRRTSSSSSNPGDVVAHYLVDPARFVVHVGVPSDHPSSWARVARSQDDRVLLISGARIPLASIRQYVVSYPSGEIVASNLGTIGVLPDGVHETAMADPPAEDKLVVSELSAADPRVRVSFGDSSDPRPGVDSCSTRITNGLDEAIRVTRFGAYARGAGNEFHLNTITDGFFTSKQFAEWYSAPSDGWIAPGASCEDPSNYGSPDSLWVYWFETQSGRTGFSYGSQTRIPASP